MVAPELFAFGKADNPGPQAAITGVEAGDKPDKAGTGPTSHADLVEQYGIVKSQLTDCVICHR